MCALLDIDAAISDNYEELVGDSKEASALKNQLDGVKEDLRKTAVDIAEDMDEEDRSIFLDAGVEFSNRFKKMENTGPEDEGRRQLLEGFVRYIEKCEVARGKNRDCEGFDVSTYGIDPTIGANGSSVGFTK